MKCPFCQHENPTGTRFCAACGFSMHLKICPNPECAKISDAGAAACEFCGQAFPKPAVAPEAASPVPAASPAPAKVPESATGSAARDKPRTAALPLIMVAIIAGGLPLLWANRASLPTPKPWQAGAPEAPKIEGAPPPVATIKPPIVPELAPTPASPRAPAAADSASPSAPAPVQASGSGADQNRPPPPVGAEVTKKDPEAPPQTGETAKEPARKVAKTPSPKKMETRPCTEAMAALGICDPRRPGQ